MEFQRLGKSGLQVSKIILGGMSFGKKSSLEWALEDEEEIFKLLKYAYDKGIRTWDTADTYSLGESEKLIGKFLKKFNIDRSKVVILSKCFFPAQTFASEYDKVNNWGLSRKYILDAVDRSVERLGTYIDVLQIHRLDKNTDKEEIMCALHDVVRSGKARYIGASSMKATSFAQLQFIAEKNSWTKFISMQNYYNLIYREEEREMIPFCQETGVGIIPWSPIARGILARPVGSEPTLREKTDPRIVSLNIGKDIDKEVITRVEKIAKSKDISMAQVAIAWTLSKGFAPIVGFSKIERIDEAIAALGVSFTEEELNFLEEAYSPHFSTV